MTGRAEFAVSWRRALDGADYVPLLPAQRAETVLGWVDRLAGMLAGTDPAQAARQVGAELVSYGYAAPDVLGCTVRLLHTELAAALGLDPAAAAPRLAALTDALTSGFVEAVRDRTLDAQDAVRMAAWIAHARAERALRAEEARFREFATHDPLTGLPNRTLFAERLDELTPGARVGVCCLDIDRFAAVNGALGHEIGDRLLEAVADRLRAVTGPAGHLVARFDGDTFAILVEGTTCEEDAVKVADRALTVLAVPFRIDGTELPVTASAGIVERYVTGDPVEVIRAAQVALQWAKADGRAGWRVFEPERGARDAERYRLSAAMPAALRRGELVPHYQPLVRLRDGKLVGTEALVRWQHPERGLLSAAEFVGLADDTGMTVPMGERMLWEACTQAARWQRGCADPPYVSVNMALQHLLHPGVVGAVAEVLAHTGLEPHLLHLELTEAEVIEGPGATQTVTALADLGVRIALDDFGVGYCNLAYLRTLPVHRVKLDRTFIHRPDRMLAAQDAEFLAATVRLGHTLGLDVTAEGIETAEQADRMRAAGCDTGQGWYHGRPVPPERITARL